MKEVKTNSELEAVRSLEFAAHYATLTGRDPYSWKWVLISVHGALQNLMALSLSAGNNLWSLRDDTAAAWLKAYKDGRRLPPDKLDFFPALFEKIQGKAMLRFGISRPFLPSPRQADSIRRLNSLRNDFIHFVPKLWRIRTDGLPQICLDAVAVCEFLAWESGNVTWHLVKASRVRTALQNAKRALNRRQTITARGMARAAVRRK